MKSDDSELRNPRAGITAKEKFFLPSRQQQARISRVSNRNLTQVQASNSGCTIL